MIKLKSQREIDCMRRAGKITAAARALAGEMVTPGVTTQEIDKAVHDFILSQGAVPAFLGYSGYPASVCISINEQVIHGIPGKRVIKNGDVVSVDVGAVFDGFVGDCAATFIAGEGSEEANKRVQVTRDSFFKGMEMAVPGNRVQDISYAVQSYVEEHGFSVVRSYVGHGIGQEMHEAPEVPNFGRPGHGPRLAAGMTLCIEPMVNAGIYQVKVLPDGWTVVKADGKLSAHYENTILITNNGPQILNPIGG